MTIGGRIKEKRAERGLSLRELAKIMGYHHSTIGKIENDLVDLPQSRIVQFADALGTTPSYLMGWEDQQKKNDALADIVLRLRTDDELFDVVNAICNLDKEKLSSLAVFLK
jgi:transcriptional regulator with XRE-family HTH domain